LRWWKAPPRVVAARRTGILAFGANASVWIARLDSGKLIRCGAPELQIVDVMPTLLSWFGLDSASCQGKDLTPLMAPDVRRKRRSVYTVELHSERRMEIR
jgi:hypothetical protein